MAIEPTWPDLTSTLIAANNLSQEQASWAMRSVMSGEASPVALAGFLVALRAKGETVEELRGLADEMILHAVPIEMSEPAVDIVGTGGDRAHTVNISTMAAIVIAGVGLRVAKHGNRASSSSSGSADVLEALGIRLDHTPERVREIFDEAGITFCFAQVFHPAFRHAGTARKELALPTVFNFLGPLTNPARPRATAVGVADRRMAELIAGVFASRGTSALVFRGDDGLDELAAIGLSTVWEVKDGAISIHSLDPVRDLGLQPTSRAELKGADAAFNAQVARDVLDGAPGPVRETVLLNAAAALVADGQAPGMGSGTFLDRLKTGYQIAEAAVDSGDAKAALGRWVAASN